MTVLLDTSVVILLEGGGLASVVGEDPVISAVSVGELAFGAGVGDAAQRRHREQRLRRVVADMEVLPFGVEEAKFYGVLASLVRAAGRNPRPRRLDLQIAATAASARLPVVTTNPDDFLGLGGLVDVIGVPPPT